MNRRLIAMVCLLLGVAAGALAQSHWTVNPRQYQYDMTVYTVLPAATQAGYEVAAFCDDECRGVGTLLTATDGTQVWQLRVRSNAASGETIRFRVYNVSQKKELWAANSIMFEAQTVTGTPGEPQTLDVKTTVKGDANGDGQVNIADVTAIIAYLTGQPPATFDAAAADTDGNGQVDYNDLKGTVALIMQ